VLPLQDERRSTARKKMLAMFNTNGTHYMTLRRYSIILVLAIVFGVLAPRTRFHVQHLSPVNPYGRSRCENSSDIYHESIWSKVRVPPLCSPGNSNIAPRSYPLRT
jgi:hypothetical protein